MNHLALRLACIGLACALAIAIAAEASAALTTDDVQSFVSRDWTLDDGNSSAVSYGSADAEIIFGGIAEVLDVRPALSFVNGSGGYDGYALADPGAGELRVISRLTFEPKSQFEQDGFPALFQANSSANALLRDRVTISGSISSGSFLTFWELDGQLYGNAPRISGRFGTIFSVDEFNTSATLLASKNCGVNVACAESSEVSITRDIGDLTDLIDPPETGFDLSQPVSELLVAAMSFAPNTSFFADYSLSADSTFTFTNGDGMDSLSVDLGADLGTTARLVRVEVTDEFGNLLTPGVDYEISSELGIDYMALAGEPVRINEVDADTAGTDTLEFIELYDGGVGNKALDGLTVVLFNGSDDASYAAFDLDGFSTDGDGYFVVGNAAVTGASLVFPDNTLQNGADAVALVAGDATDYPNDTPVDTAAVLDAIVYDTNDGDDAGLAVLLNAGQPQVNEDGAGNKDFDSNQRCPNGSGGQRNTDTYRQATPTPGLDNNCDPVAVEPAMISAIQGTPETQGSNSFGDTDVSPLIGQVVTVEAVVVGDFQDGDADTSRNLRGFFLQEETSDEDGDPESSEGIFVFENGNFITDVNVGDLVQVTGTVDQFFGETQLDNVTSVTVIATGRLGDVSVANITLPSSNTTLSQDGDPQPDLEAFEGMLVTVIDTLQITEQFQLDRFNEIKLVSGARPVQFTQENTPNVAGYDAFLEALGARRITYDDGLNVQNANISNLDGFAPYTEATARRMGDTVQGLTGVLDYKWAGNSASGATWRIRSHIDGTNTFTSTLNGNSPNPRPLSAPAIPGNVKVASFNVLNFFTTLDQGDNATANGSDPRGADSPEEFERQLSKTVNALAELDADIVGLIEIENEFDPINDGSTALEVLVNALNAEVGAGTYDYVYPGTRFLGTDAIAVALMYKTGVAALTDGTAPAVLDDIVADSLNIFSLDDFPIFDGVATNRNPLAASFTHLETGEVFTVVVNHFKSKGSSGLTDTTDLNFDQGDGAGFWNERRLNAALAVDFWLETDPTGSGDDDIILLGDLNAYAQEDPVQYLLGQGFVDVDEPGAYSFVFDGQVGTLDYILISASLADRLAGAAVWGINADEADALDYNLDFGRDPTYYDGTTATRNSDHDPVVAGFSFKAQVLGVKVILEAYIGGLESGELSGAGSRGFLSQLRELLLLGKIKLALRAEEDGRLEAQCAALAFVDRRSDGERRPYDWLTGEGLADFNGLVNRVRGDAGCA